MSRTVQILVALTASAALAGGCSSSTSSTTSSSPAASGPVTSPATGTTAPASTSPAPTSPAQASGHSSPVGAAGLSGIWNGTYGGPFKGTFVLTWTQSSAKLSGTIKLSDPGSTLPIIGTVAGGHISFGTIGSTAITYTGSVSGASMSGNYQVAGASSSGTWSAHKG